MVVHTYQYVWFTSSVQNPMLVFEGLPQGWTDPRPMAVRDSLDNVCPWMKQERFPMDVV